MSGYPIVLEGTAISALVVGGGRVATRKVLALLDAGAAVHVVAPVVTPRLEQAAERYDDLRITRARFALEHFGDAPLVIAATDDPRTNAWIAAEARARARLVNVVDSPEQGDWITPAVHRSGDVVVAVTAGRVPAAAVRIRDRIAGVVDQRFASAVIDLCALRRDLLARGARERWLGANAALVGDDFCERVESGDFDVRAAEWR